MAVKYLLDTNILSATLNTKPNRQLRLRLNDLADDCATAAPVWYELWSGCLRMPASSRRDYLQHELLHTIRIRLPILPYDEDAASAHAAIAVQMGQRGRTVPFRDAQIAAVALTHGATLITDNVRDFRHIPGLAVENWLRA
jgi:tRNA(fMet)-specific endonuclease VapC